MQPTSAAFLRLLSFVFALIAVEFCASLSRWLVCNVHFDKFCPSTDLGVGRNVSVWVLNMVLFQNFFKVQCFEVACGVDYSTFFNEEATVVIRCDAFSAQFVVYAFLPEAFPLYAEFFNHFFLLQSHLYRVPP